LAICWIFILLSIKTRIETGIQHDMHGVSVIIFILLSIKTRIETCITYNIKNIFNNIFILLSIKTRIETPTITDANHDKGKFLSYYPLKQGLKWGIYIYVIGVLTVFLSYYPLKQGLKHNSQFRILASRCIFILLSIKTRIETDRAWHSITSILYFYPTIH